MAESMVGLMDPTNRMETWDEEEDRVVSHSVIPYCLGGHLSRSTCVYLQGNACDGEGDSI